MMTTAHPTHRVGLIGADIGPSLSPVLHEHEALALGLDYAYDLIDIAELGVPPVGIGMGAEWPAGSALAVSGPSREASSP